MKKRNVSLDLYRLLCMFLITTIHIFNIHYTDFAAHIPNGHFNFWIMNVLQVFQKIAISGFTLISAYYLVDKHSCGKKLITFVLQVWFYSVLIYLLSLVFVKRDFSPFLILNAFFPVLTNHYWYPVNYVFLLVMAPFLNRIVRGIARKELLSGILLLASAVSVFYPLNPFFETPGFVGHQTHSLLWFILLYLIAAYLKVYGVQKPKRWLVVFSICALTLFAVVTLNNNGFGIAQRFPVIQKVIEKTDLLAYNSVFALLLCVSSFILFSHLKLDPPNWLRHILTAIMPSVFVIYLLQEHNAIRMPLWNFVNMTRWSDSLLMLPVILLVFAALFAGAFVLYQIYRLAHKLFLSKLEAKLSTIFHLND